MGTARRDIAQQSTKMPEAPSWGFYYAACGDILKLHDYLCHPNAPNQTTGEALVNNQLDSSDDLMPSKKYIEQHRLETSSSEMFRRGEAEGGIPVWRHLLASGAPEQANRSCAVDSQEGHQQHSRGEELARSYSCRYSCTGRSAMAASRAPCGLDCNRCAPRP